MPIKVRTTNAFFNGLTAGTTNAGEGSPRVADEPLTHAEMDDNITSVWPVGSIYMNITDNRNPRDIIGFGQWTSFGRQTILVGTNNSPATDEQPETRTSRRIVAAKVSTNPSLNQCKLVLTLDTNNDPFSTGQKVTIRGITNSGGSFTVNPNREREILNLGDENGNSTTTKITVDYRSPAANPNTLNAVLGVNETLSVNNAAATLFGTRVNLASPAMGYGLGGSISHNLTVNQIPSHTHSTSWNTVQSRHKHSGAGIDLSDGYGPVEGSGVADVKLSARGWRRGGGRATDITHGTYGYAHNNLMPFIGCYMWLRVQ